MMIRVHQGRIRRGAVLVEAAIVYSAFLGLLLGGLSIGLGVFRYQEIAHLAREAARWASLQEASGRTPALIRARVVSKAAGIDPDALTVTTTPAVAGMATVKVEYSWLPPMSPAPITLRSTARARIVGE